MSAIVILESRKLKNLLGFLILLCFIIILYTFFSGGKIFYLGNLKIRLNHLHNPLLIFSILLALRLALFKKQEFFLHKTILQCSQKYTEFINNNKGKEYFIYFSIIFIVTTLCYLGIFDNFFIREDFHLLEEALKANNNFLYVFSMKGLHLFRPLFNFLFLLNYKLSGLNPAGYYVVNFIIHLCNIILLFYLTYILTNKRLISFLASLLFAVNFEHYQAVIHISGRPGSGATVVYLLTMIFFLKYVITKEKKFYIASLLTFSLSLLHYEGTVTLLPMMFLYDIIFHEKFCFSNFFRFMKRYFLFALLLMSYLIFTYLIQSHNVLVTEKVYVFNFHFLYQIFRSTITINEWIIPLFIVFVIFLISDVDKKSIKDLFNSPVLLFSFLWIIVSLVPFSFFQNRSIVVSRYFYIPSIGSSILFSLLIYRVYQTGRQFIANQEVIDKRFITSLITITLVIILANILATYQQEHFFGKKPNWRKIISTLKSEYRPFPEHSQIYFLNISTEEPQVKALTHVFFSPTIEAFSSKTGDINIQKTNPASIKKVFIFDYVNGKIIDRSSEYNNPATQKIPYP